ncbi:serine/threonine-protein kinase-like protein CCR3-like, partial [Trifolium medium]|nr:serine/threonine-protein kinase-like protein CCR3-like [Trifolium medium]
MSQDSRITRRQRSGPSSTKHQERAEEFSLSDNNNSAENWGYG